MVVGAKRSKHRSDEIRRRRSDRTRQVRKKFRRREKLVTTNTSPPVMARVVGQSLSTNDDGRSGRKTTGKTRRRFDVALSTPGAEMRLPSLPQVRVGWRLVSCLLFGLLAFVLYQFWNLPMYRIDAAEVVGLQRLTSSDVNSVLGITGKQVFAMDAEGLQDVLTDTFPEISEVSVRVELPHSVLITVTERTPVLIWLQDGRSNLIDADGVTFPKREGSQSGSYPVIEAMGDPPPIETSDSESETSAPTMEFPDLEALAEELPLVNPASGEAEQLLTPEMVSTILLLAEKAPEGAKLIYSPDFGMGWKDPRNWEVHLGSGEDFEIKLLVYEAILQELRARDTRPTLINVEHVHAPYYRLVQ